MTTVKEKQNIPNGWQEKKIVDVCNIINGSTPKSGVASYWSGDVVWVTPNDLRDSSFYVKDSERKITKEGLRSIGNRLVPKNSVILSTRAPIGYLGVTQQETAFNQGCKGLVCKTDLTAFLYYVLQRNTENLKKLGAGSTFLELSTSNLEKYIILIPPIKEQQKIAEILGGVDEDIAKTQEVIGATEKLKRGLMQQLFTRGIGHTKFTETKLGEIPKEWEVVRLGDVGTNHIGLTYSPNNVVDENGTLVLRSSNVKNGVIVYGDNVYVDAKIPDHLITKSGDILLCTRNGSRDLIGKCAYLDGHSVGHSFGAFMSVYRSKYSKFIFQVFQSDIFKDQINRHLGATINQITNTSLNSFIVPLPPDDEQKKIVEILSAVDEKISVNKKLKEKLTVLKKGLMQDLLSGKVRVDRFTDASKTIK